MAHFVVPTVAAPEFIDFFVTAILERGGSITVGVQMDWREDESEAIRQVLAEVERHHGNVVEHFTQERE